MPKYLTIKDKYGSHVDGITAELSEKDLQEIKTNCDSYEFTISYTDKQPESGNFIWKWLSNEKTTEIEPDEVVAEESEEVSAEEEIEPKKGSKNGKRNRIQSGS